MTFKTQYSILFFILLLTLNIACKNDDDANSNDPLASCCSVSPLQIEFDGAKVFIPNAFSPNGDGINDIFTVFGGAFLEKVNSLQVFDGSTMIFERNDFLPNEPQQGWDGSISGNSPAEDGVYTYKVSLTSITNEETADFEGEVCLRTEGPNSSNFPCVEFESQCRYGLQHDGEGGFDPFLDSGELCD